MIDEIGNNKSFHIRIHDDLVINTTALSGTVL